MPNKFELEIASKIVKGLAETPVGHEVEAAAERAATTLGHQAMGLLKGSPAAQAAVTEGEKFLGQLTLTESAVAKTGEAIPVSKLMDAIHGTEGASPDAWVQARMGGQSRFENPLRARRLRFAEGMSRLAKAGDQAAMQLKPEFAAGE